MSTSGQITVGSGTSLDYESRNSYAVVVTAADPSGATDTIAVTINVTNVDEAPDVSGQTAVEYAENGTGAVANYTATDPEGDTSITWTLAGDDSGDFTLADGVLAFNASPNFESAADCNTDNAYLITVQASDGTKTGVLDVTINVTDVDEVPGQPATPTVAAAGSDRLTVSWTEPANTGPAITDYDYRYSVKDTSAWTEVTDTAITATSVSITGLSANAEYEAQVRAISDEGTGEWSESGIGATGSAAATNANPAFDEGETATRTVPENSGEGTSVGTAVAATDSNGGDILTYALTGTGSSNFAIDSGGQITVAAGATLDHESAPSYSLSATVRDGKDADGNADTSVDDTIAVTINVTNVDEAGAVSLSSDQPQVGTELTATLADPDGGVSGATWTWARSADGSDGSWATISGASSTDTTSAYTPVDGDVDNYLRAGASYTDPQGDGKSAQAASVNQVQAAPVINLHPIFSDGTTTIRSVAENSPQGTNVGTAVSATDADSLTYTLSGTGAGSFEIGAGTGQITVGSGTSLDYETRNSYAVVVTAADPSGATDAIAVTINVTDVNESPTATADTASIEENTSVDINVVANDTDPDAGTTLSVTAVSTAPTSGPAEIKSGSTTTVIYIPDTGFSGEDSFDYTVSDGTATATGTVKVVVYTPAPTPSSTQSAQGVPVGAETKAGAPGGHVTVEFPEGASTGTPFQVRVDDAANQDCGNLPSGQIILECSQVDLFKLDGTNWDTTTDGTPFISANLIISVSDTQDISVYRREDPSDSWTSIPRCAGSTVECFTVSSGRVTIQYIPDFSQFAVVRPRTSSQDVTPTATITRRRRGVPVTQPTATPAPVVVATPSPTEMALPATDTPVSTSVAPTADPPTPELRAAVRPTAAPPTPLPTRSGSPTATPPVAPTPTDTPATVAAIPNKPVPASTTALPPVVEAGGSFPAWLIVVIVAAVIIAGGLGFGAWRMLRPQ